MSCFPSPPETSNKIFTKRNERLAVASNRGIWTSIGLAESGWRHLGSNKWYLMFARKPSWGNGTVSQYLQGFYIPGDAFFTKKTTIQAKSRGHIFGFVISAMMQVPKIWTRKWWWQLIVIFFPWDPSHPSKITHKTPPSKRLNTIFIRGNPSNLNRNSPEIGQEYKNLYWLVVWTHLKNISQNGSFPQIGMNIKNHWNHQKYIL